MEFNKLLGPEVILVHHQVFVYGTLLAGEVNHHLLAGAELRGTHRTEPCFTMFRLGSYPGVVKGGRTAVSGEVYRIEAKVLECLDRLEGYPRVYDRALIPSPYGRTWIYIYRGRIAGRRSIGSGDWRSLTGTADSFRRTGCCTVTDRKNPRWRERLGRRKVY